MALLYERAERLTAILGGFRPGQWHGLDVREQLDMQKGSPRRTSASFGSGGTGMSPLTLHVAHAATRPTISRVSLHEDGRHAVVVHEAHESRCWPSLRSSS